MKAWRLLKGNRVLEILDIDPSTREVRKAIPLHLKEPMTHHEAEIYMRHHYPHPELEVVQ